MTDTYRLIYRGEVQQGQHPAVVRKRLQALLKVDDAQADRLFSGEVIVLKKAVDEAAAARFQNAFKKSGAVLRVARVETGLPAAAAGAPAAAAAAPAQAAPPATDTLQLMPTGSDVLREDERVDHAEADIDTSHIKLQGAVFTTTDAPAEILGPDVSHLTLDEVGARLGPELDNLPDAPLDVNFDLADVGVDLAEPGVEAPTPAVPDVNFEVAEPGARMEPEANEPPPPAPDTSHLQIESER